MSLYVCSMCKLPLYASSTVAIDDFRFDCDSGSIVYLNGNVRLGIDIWLLLSHDSPMPLKGAFK